MQVELIDYTGKPDPWYGAAKMIFTKRTRIEMTAQGFEACLALSPIDKLKELEYMANTIPSSWEFMHFTFLFRGVTRAFTHQLVRSRQFSFAQQSMQISRVDGFGYYTGKTVADDRDAKTLYDETMKTVSKAYTALCNMGVRIEDARGLLPTNIENNIVMDGHLRGYADLLRKRASPRNMGAVHGEWAAAIREMRRLMIDACPWADLFINRTADIVARETYAKIEKIGDGALRTELHKAIDQLMTMEQD
jgi:thymidylate synthase (FAD)